MKRLILFILLTISYTCVNANTLDLKKTHDANTKILLDNCSLPAPTGLVALTTAQNLVGLTWSPVPGAVDYQIKTIEVASGNVVNTSYTTNTYFVTNPGSPQCYNFEVRAGCGLSQYSPNFASAQVCIEWVIDLIVDRYHCPNVEPGDSNIPVNGSLDISFSPNTIYDLRIYRNGNGGSINGESKIRFGEVINDSHIMFQQVNSKQQNYLPYGTLSYLQPPFGACINSINSVKIIHVANCGGSISTEYVGLELPQTGTLRVSDLDPINDYTVNLVTVCSTGQRSDLSTDTEAQVSANPNPFTNEINLYLPDMESENTTVQLFDLTGKLYYSKLSGLSTNQVTIPTSELPTGIYILRTQTADRVQTIKMIKTE